MSFQKFSGGNTPGPLQREGRPLLHLTPSTAFGRARGASAPVLGLKPRSPSTFQPWLRPCTGSLTSLYNLITKLCNVPHNKNTELVLTAFRQQLTMGHWNGLRQFLQREC